MKDKILGNNLSHAIVDEHGLSDNVVGVVTHTDLGRNDFSATATVAFTADGQMIVTDMKYSPSFTFGKHYTEEEADAELRKFLLGKTP